MTRSAQISRMLVQTFGFSNGCGGIGVEEAAAVGAELLDDFLARHRPNGNRLLRPFERGRIDRAGKRLRHAKSEQDKGADE